jgi:serpin B
MVRFLMMMVLAICLLLGVELRNAGGRPVIRLDNSAFLGGNNQFAIDLFRAIRSRPGNVSLAPASVSAALAMTYEGARGQTAGEMARVLHLPADREAVHSGFRELIARLNGDGNERPYRLASTNSLWGEQRDHFLPDFTRTLADVYQAELHSVDFRNAAEAARRAINTWVDGKTNHLIPELLASGDVRSDTSLVLVNTVYFKGSWVYPFAKAATAPADFHLADGSKISVPTMRPTHRLSHAQGDGFGLLELPYKGGDLAFDIVLPDDGVPLDKVESNLSLPQLRQAIDLLGERDVALTMPRFKVTAGAELSKPLSGLGMATAFTRHADFSGIDGTRELYLSKVVHQVVVNLDEEGTEAAAGTAAIVTRAMARVSVPLVFRIDRPFLYLIRDVKTGTILFLGRVADPTR